jgi:hypothetical protein
MAAAWSQTPHLLQWLAEVGYELKPLVSELKPLRYELLEGFELE